MNWQLDGYKGYLGGLGKIAVGAFVLYLSTQQSLTADIRAALAPAGLYAVFSGLGTIGVRGKQQRLDEKLDETAAKTVAVTANAVEATEQTTREVMREVLR